VHWWWPCHDGGVASKASECSTLASVGLGGVNSVKGLTGGRGVRVSVLCLCAWRPEAALAYTLPVWSVMAEQRGPAASRGKDRGSPLVSWEIGWRCSGGLWLCRDEAVQCRAASMWWIEESSSAAATPATSGAPSSSSIPFLSGLSLLARVSSGWPQGGGGGQESAWASEAGVFIAELIHGARRTVDGELGAIGGLLARLG